MFFSKIPSTILFSIQFFGSGTKEFAETDNYFGGIGFENLYFFEISNPTFCLRVGNFQIETNENVVKTKENFRI